MTFRVRDSISRYFPRALLREARALRIRERPTTSVASAVGALALGAIAIGALAVGVVAIGRLAIGRARIRRLEIDELVVRKLRVTEALQVPPKPDWESTSGPETSGTDVNNLLR